MTRFATRMPGFEADASLEPARSHYAARSGGAPPAVVAAARLPFGDGCIPGCLCVKEEGCPCCKSIFDFPTWPRLPIRELAL